MTPYVRQMLTDADVDLFEKIRAVVQALPDIALAHGRCISCHVLARALTQFFRAEYRDGYFFKGYRHSWLITQSGNLIDPYPIAVFGGPVLLYCVPPILSPWRRLYKEARLRDIEGEISAMDIEKVV